MIVTIYQSQRTSSLSFILTHSNPFVYEFNYEDFIKFIGKGKIIITAVYSRSQTSVYVTPSNALKYFKKFSK